jgi:hypothetical protein
MSDLFIKSIVMAIVFELAIYIFLGINLFALVMTYIPGLQTAFGFLNFFSFGLVDLIGNFLLLWFASVILLLLRGSD